MDHLNCGKFLVTKPTAVVWCHWSLECMKLRISHQGFADIMTRLFIVRLIHDGQPELFGKWPFQEIIIITLHEMNEQCDVFTHTIIYTIQVDPQAQLVPIQTGVKCRAVFCSTCSTDGILATLCEILNSPGVRSITETPLLL